MRGSSSSSSSSKEKKQVWKEVEEKGILSKGDGASNTQNKAQGSTSVHK